MMVFAHGSMKHAGHGAVQATNLIDNAANTIRQKAASYSPRVLHQGLRA